MRVVASEFCEQVPLYFLRRRAHTYIIQAAGRCLLSLYSSSAPASLEMLSPPFDAGELPAGSPESWPGLPGVFLPSFGGDLATGINWPHLCGRD